MKKRGISIKDRVREAVKDWVLGESDLNKDPLLDTSNIIMGKAVTDCIEYHDTYPWQKRLFQALPLVIITNLLMFLR